MSARRADRDQGNSLGAVQWGIRLERSGSECKKPRCHHLPCDTMELEILGWPGPLTELAKCTKMLKCAPTRTVPCTKLPRLTPLCHPPPAAARSLQPRHRWCHFCTSPALFEIYTPSSSPSSLSLRDLPEERGSEPPDARRSSLPLNPHRC